LVKEKNGLLKAFLVGYYKVNISQTKT